MYTRSLTQLSPSSYPSIGLQNSEHLPFGDRVSPCECSDVLFKLCPIVWADWAPRLHATRECLARLPAPPFPPDSVDRRKLHSSVNFVYEISWSEFAASSSARASSMAVVALSYWGGAESWWGYRWLNRRVEYTDTVRLHMRYMLGIQN